MFDRPVGVVNVNAVGVAVDEISADGIVVNAVVEVSDGVVEVLSSSVLVLSSSYWIWRFWKSNKDIR